MSTLQQKKQLGVAERSHSFLSDSLVSRVRKLAITARHSYLKLGETS